MPGLGIAGCDGGNLNLMIRRFKCLVAGLEFSFYQVLLRTRAPVAWALPSLTPKGLVSDLPDAHRRETTLGRVRLFRAMAAGSCPNCFR